MTLNEYSHGEQKEENLDPADWESHRMIAHRMVDDMFSYLATISHQPAWKKIPDAVKDTYNKPLPREGESLAKIYEDFLIQVLPYNTGNVHPRFFSWVHGTGTMSGALADMLASAMNANLVMGEHSPVYIERQIIDWCKEMLGFPASSSGILVSGGSMANATALAVARNNFKNGIIKKEGFTIGNYRLVTYCSAQTHNCIFKAVETIGLGSDYLRKIPTNDLFEMDTVQLEMQIAEDKKLGLIPFCVVGTAGTVNTGAIDPIIELYNICKKEKMWLHIDGAIGAVVKLLPEYAGKLKGMELADSIAFDLHKWMHINYEVGCLLVKDAAVHRNSFAHQTEYLSKHERGLAAGPDSFSNYGLDLSRNFKSLKVWFCFREHGVDKYARLMRQNIKQANYLASKIQEATDLELLAPVNLHIVCFRFNPRQLSLETEALNNLNRELLMRIQELGIASPSYTTIKNQYAIRVSINNHRTNTSDLNVLLASVIDIGNGIISNAPQLLSN